MLRSTVKSYWYIFRFFFVLFSLYLLGDAFSRWDGFRYYAPFSEFLPALALITILWTFTAALTALFTWLFSKVIVRVSGRTKFKISTEQVLLFVCILFYLLIAIWKIKAYVHPAPGVELYIKLLLFLLASFIGICIIFLLDKRADNFISSLQTHIRPLVWLFGICFIFSVNVLIYHTLIEKFDDVRPPNASLSPNNQYRPNIILVTFDALSARHMSGYGYRRGTTPFIRKWAEKASLFTRLEAASNFTMPTTATLMTGKRLWTHQTFHQQGSRPDKRENENLPLVLMKNGYYTMAFVQNYNASVRTLDIVSSFNYAPRTSSFWRPNTLLGYIDKFLFYLFAHKIRLYEWIIKPDFIFLELINLFSPDPTETETPAEAMFQSFLAKIDNIPQKPFFAWIHVLPPHEPYLPPLPYRGMFAPLPKTHNITTATKRDRYDEFIRYCDKQFEDFIAELEKRDNLKNTIIILSADHGESFEHNYIGHGGEHLYEDVTHIPLIIKTPGQTDGKIINTLVGQTGLPVTILDLAGISIPSWMEGRSVTPLLNDKQLPAKAVFSMNLEKNFSRGHTISNGTIAVWEGDYKLISYLNKNTTYLFNLRQDPDELANLSQKEPAIAQRLLDTIKEELAKANKKIVLTNGGN